VISFACGELGIMRLDDVLDMSFAEFQIRLFAYKRIQLKEWEKVRFMGWCSTIGSHQDPKKMPKNINAFMPLDLDNKKVTKVSDAMKERFLEEYKTYLTQVNNNG